MHFDKYIMSVSTITSSLLVKHLPANNAGDVRDAGSIPSLGRSPGGGHGNPLQFFLPGESYGQRNLAGL